MFHDFPPLLSAIKAKKTSLTHTFSPIVNACRINSNTLSDIRKFSVNISSYNKTYKAYHFNNQQNSRSLLHFALSIFKQRGGTSHQNTDIQFYYFIFFFADLLLAAKTSENVNGLLGSRTRLCAARLRTLPTLTSEFPAHWVPKQGTGASMFPKFQLSDFGCTGNSV